MQERPEPTLELLKHKIHELYDEEVDSDTSLDDLGNEEEGIWELIEWFEATYNVVIESDKIYTDIQTVGELYTYFLGLSEMPF
jgi:hypothetical protein